jgi:hypothetical protein
LRARLIIRALKQDLLLSRDREGAVLFADSIQFCKYLFSLSERGPPASQIVLFSLEYNKMAGAQGRPPWAS